MNTQHDDARDLVGLILRASIKAPDRFDWSLQGFGMFRIYAKEDKVTRIHVWDDRFKTENVTTIHNHPWHFTSTIVSGRIFDRRYRVRPATYERATHHKMRIVCGPGGGACKEEVAKPVVLSPLANYEFRAGDTYGILADEYHETFADRGTITIVRRSFLEDSEHAYVCYPYDQEWVSAEPRPATADEVCAMAKRALEGLAR